MRVVLSALARGVRAADALAWWWDFRDGKSDHAFLWLRTRRRVLARAPDRVEAEERAPFFRERWTAWRAPEAVRFEGRNGFATFSGSYHFSPDAQGARIVLDAVIELRGAWRAVGWLARPIVRGVLRADLRGHAAELAAELASPTPQKA